MLTSSRIFLSLIGICVPLFVLLLGAPSGSEAFDPIEIKVLERLYVRYSVQEWWMPPDCNWPYITCDSD
jgi:hypothetical protein